MQQPTSGPPDVPPVPIAKRVARTVLPRGVRRWVWEQVIDRPLASRAFLLLDPEARLRRLSPRTDLLVDGFLRCANTYATAAFAQANPGRRLSHHLHHPRIFERAVALGVPALLVVRRPADVLASMLQFDPESDAATVLDTYVWFHERVEPLLDRVVVSDFPQTTGDFGAVVARVNARFGTTFTPYVRTPEAEAEVFAAVEEFSARYHARTGWEARVSRPSRARRPTEEYVAALTAADRERLRHAERVHARFAARAHG